MDLQSTTPMQNLRLDTATWVSGSKSGGWPCEADGKTYDAKDISEAPDNKHESLQHVRKNNFYNRRLIHTITKIHSRES